MTTQIPTRSTGVPSDARIEWQLLGDIFSLATCDDRAPGAYMPRDCDPITGLPKDEAPRTVMFNGQQIMTLGSRVLPLNQARGGISLACSATLWAGSEDGEGGRTPGLAAHHTILIENGKERRLSDIPQKEWPVAALKHWRDYAFAIRRVFAHWARLGLIDPCPTLYENPEPLGLDCLPRVARPTFKGVQFAMKVIPGTPWANRPKSALHDLTPEERATQPQYARESYALETGGSAPGILIDPFKSNEIKEETSCPGSSCSLPVEAPSSKTTLPTPTPSEPASPPPVTPTASGS